MLIRFKCETLDKDLIPFSIWMLQVPFEPEEAQYYVATLNSKENEEILNCCEIDPALCFDEIKNLLNSYNYKVKDLSYINMLEPENEFAKLLIEFQS